MDTAAPATETFYPESDGKPMSDITLQWDWMVKIVGELREQFAGLEVFVAGNLFWYPVEGEPKTVTAPDAVVAFGRPPGYRGSYRQWREAGVTPQVVFEVLSPSNTDDELADKLEFYDRFGVDEYFVVDPYRHEYEAYIRRRGNLQPVPTSRLNGFISPRLAVRFAVGDVELSLVGPTGRVFQTREERSAELTAEFDRVAAEAAELRTRLALAERQAAADRQRAAVARQQSDAAAARAETAERQVEQSDERANRLAAKLRELGLDPDAV